MLLLIAGLCLFLGTHLLPEIGLRERLITHLGTGPYKLYYSLLSLAGLGLIVIGKSSAPFIQIWQPVYEWRVVTHYLMLPAIILVAAGNLPMSILRQHLRHPMLLGVALWGAAHLWANGDLASILIFGSFTLWAVIKIVSLLQRSPAVPVRGAFTWDLIAIIIVGLPVYFLIAVYHGQLFGIGLTFD